MDPTTEKERIPTDIEKDIVTHTSNGTHKHVPDYLLKHSHDADAALKAFEGFEGQRAVLTEEENKRLLRKIDMHLMPVSSSGSISERVLTAEN
jgi:ACS family allantoate permease-like MFS transporter